MRVGERVGKYVMTRKSRIVGPDDCIETWVFSDGVNTVEWNNTEKIPSEADLAPHSGGDC